MYKIQVLKIHFTLCQKINTFYTSKMWTMDVLKILKNAFCHSWKVAKLSVTTCLSPYLNDGFLKIIQLLNV
jgi:hypothetical protein